MLKRALFLVTNESEIDALCKFSKAISKKYDVETHVLYVEDVLKYEVYPSTINGVGLNVGLNYSYQEYISIESKNYKTIKEKIEKIFSRKDIKKLEKERILEVITNISNWKIII